MRQGRSTGAVRILRAFYEKSDLARSSFDHESCIPAISETCTNGCGHVVDKYSQPL